MLGIRSPLKDYDLFHVLACLPKRQKLRLVEKCREDVWIMNEACVFVEGEDDQGFS